ncbi:MAG: helix-hairpin-helix domain-containing protein [Betaproteobacteria bacterium]|nr:helix-hairpin-helix domain-containing protein [Betaproteobacteria bacterium]
MNAATSRRLSWSVFRRLLLAWVASFVLLGQAWAVVDINSADEKLLRTVKGIGPIKAKAILAYRAKNGVFRSVADLRKVKGFGAKTVARIGPEISISGKPVAVAATSGTKPAPLPRGRH